MFRTISTTYTSLAADDHASEMIQPRSSNHEPGKRHHRVHIVTPSRSVCSFHQSSPDDHTSEMIQSRSSDHKPGKRHHCVHIVTSSRSVYSFHQSSPDDHTSEMIQSRSSDHKPGKRHHCVHIVTSLLEPFLITPPNMVRIQLLSQLRPASSFPQKQAS